MYNIDDILAHRYRSAYFSMSFFTGEQAAARYNTFRPKVHGVAVQWLAQALPARRRFRRALDIACGTGDSMVPLLQIADRVQGVDRSAAMVQVARARGLEATQLSVEQLAPDDHDLLSVCMAYHWFAQESAVAAMKRASADGAVWLIYNFALTGNDGDAGLDEWLTQRYLQLFPAPPRAAVKFAPESDPELAMLKQGTGWIPVSFSRDQLVGYLTTQTNVEAALSHGLTYDDVDRLLLAEVPAFESRDDFRYTFSYSIVLFTRGSGPAPRGPKEL
jgi:SAM-dependent methyltransferase